MNSTKFLMVASAISLAMVLAGCKHNRDTASGPDDGGITPGGLLALAADDTASNALKDGETLKASANESSAVELNHTGNTAKSASAAGFSIKKNADGGVDMTVNGETVSFAAADAYIEPDGKSYGWEQEPTSGQYKSLYSYSAGESSNAIDGTDSGYLQVWKYQVDSPDDKSTRGFAVVGAETPESVVKGHANATYVGWGGAETAETMDSRERNRVSGDLALKADFAAGSVSGSMDNLWGQVRGAATGNTWSSAGSVDGKIIMGAAKISSNGFSGGALSLDEAAKAALGADIAGSTYSGRFYGPDVDQVGGVMNVKGTNDEGKSFVGSGYFVGDKQVAP